MQNPVISPRHQLLLPLSTITELKTPQPQIGWQPLNVFDFVFMPLIAATQGYNSPWEAGPNALTCLFFVRNLLLTMPCWNEAGASLPCLHCAAARILAIHASIVVVVLKLLHDSRMFTSELKSHSLQPWRSKKTALQIFSIAPATWRRNIHVWIILNIYLESFWIISHHIPAKLSTLQFVFLQVLIAFATTLWH